MRRSKISLYVVRWNQDQMMFEAVFQIHISSDFLLFLVLLFSQRQKQPQERRSALILYSACWCPLPRYRSETSRKLRLNIIQPYLLQWEKLNSQLVPLGWMAKIGSCNITLIFSYVGDTCTWRAKRWFWLNLRVIIFPAGQTFGTTFKGSWS